MGKVKIVNVTPHEVHDVNTGLRFQQSGKVARAIMESNEIVEHPLNNLGIGVYESKLKLIVNMPEKEEGTIYIVSALVMKYLQDKRDDIVCPGNVIRDKDGAVIGCQGFKRNL